MSSNGGTEELEPKSQEYIQRKRRQHEKRKQYGDRYHLLAYAIIYTIFYLVTLGLTISLIVLYLDRAYYGPAAGLIVMLVLKGIVQIIIDYFSFNRIKFCVFDILQLREVVELYYYYRSWSLNRRRSWRLPYYRPHAAFQSLKVEIPSLCIQSFVLLEYPDYNDLQVAAIVFSSLLTSVAMLSSFFYLTVSPRIYISMVLMGAYSTILRIVLAAFMMAYIGPYIVLWAGVSFLVGLAIIYIMFRRAEYYKKDDPLQLRSVKILFAILKSIQMVFTAAPFGVEHRVTEWWFGYIIAEVKLFVEYGLAVALLVLTYTRERDTTFYALFAISICGLVAYITLLYIINMGVSRSLRRRSLFTTTKIISMFYFFGNHLQETLTGEKQLDGNGLTDELDIEKNGLKGADPEDDDKPQLKHLASFTHLSSNSRMTTDSNSISLNTMNTQTGIVITLDSPNRPPAAAAASPQSASTGDGATTPVPVAMSTPSSDTPSQQSPPAAVADSPTTVELAEQAQHTFDPVPGMEAAAQDHHHAGGDGAQPDANADADFIPASAPDDLDNDFSVED